MPSNQVAAALAGPPEQASSAQGLLGATGLAAAGLTGLVAGALYEAGGRLTVATTTAAVMVAFLLAARAIAASAGRPRIGPKVPTRPAAGPGTMQR